MENIFGVLNFQCTQQWSIISENSIKKNKISNLLGTGWSSHKLSFGVSCHPQHPFAVVWNFSFRPNLEMSILHSVVMMMMMFRPWNAGPRRLGIFFLDSIVPSFVEQLQDEVSFSISEALEPVQHLEQVRNRFVVCGNFYTLRFGFWHRNGNLQNS